VGAIQLREKDMPASKLLQIAKELSAKLNKYKTKLLINERLDVAILSNSSGVHSPAAGISNPDIRKYSNLLVSGRSVHSKAEAVKAEKDGFDYILFGPVFRTPAKIKYGKPQGLDRLKKVCSSVNIPVFAVGGITPKRAKKCINCGAYGIAGVREFMTAIDPKKTVNDYMKEITGN